MPPRRAARALLALLGSLLLLDAGITLLATGDGLFLGRPLPPFGATPHPSQRAWVASERNRPANEMPSDTTGLFDPELGWTLRPGSSRRDESVGALGARGPREHARAKPDGTLRLLCFGDSFTFGAEVSDAEAWPAQLEAARPRLEAINFGVGGYGTDQAILRFRRLGRDLGADAVLVGFLLENVGRNVNRYRPLYYPATGIPGAKPRFRLEGEDLVLLPQPFPTREAFARAVEDGSVLSLLSEGEHWSRGGLPGLLRFSSLARLAAAHRAYSLRQTRRLLLDERGEPFRVTVALLEAFHREALACGAREAPVLVFPREEEMEALVGRDERYWKGILEALRTRSVPFLDLSEPLAAAYRAAREDPSAPAVYRAGHLSPLGNRIVAETVLGWVRERFGP